MISSVIGVIIPCATAEGHNCSFVKQLYHHLLDVGRDEAAQQHQHPSLAAFHEAESLPYADVERGANIKAMTWKIDNLGMSVNGVSPVNHH